MSSFLAVWPLTASAVAAHPLDLRFLDREFEQEHLVLGGRAIAYSFAISQLMRWAENIQEDAVGRARVAIEFLKADIDGIAREFDLLATGILDNEASPAAPPVGTVLSRSTTRSLVTAPASYDRPDAATPGGPPGRPPGRGMSTTAG